MGIKSKMMKAAPKLASRPTRSQRKKDALASKAKAAARAAAATLRRRPTAGTRSRPSWLKATPQGLSSRKRSR